jgi:hypothetical protein
VPFTKGAEQPALKLVDAHCSQQEFFALPDMQCDGVPARSLVFCEILQGVAAISGDIVNKRDFTRCVEADGFRIASTVVRLPRMAASGRLVPTKHLIVVLGMAVAHFRVVLGAPDVPLDAQVLLPKLVDQAREGPKEAFFHRFPQRAEALRVGFVFLEDGRQARFPMAQRFFLGVRNIAKVGFGHPRHGVWGRQRIQQHPGVVGDHAVKLVGEVGPQVGTTPASLQNLALLGIGTTADVSNPFSAKLNAALWTAKTVAEGGTGDLFYTMNKEAAGDDLGLTLQTGFVTKALVGLFGSDRFRLAVSADGSTFFDGLSVDNATGIVDQPRPPRFKAYTNYDNYVGVGTWTKIGLNNTDHNDQGAFDAANNHFVAPVDGTYLFGATLLYKIDASATARMRGRLVLNGTTEIRGSLGEISATHVSLATAIWLQTMVPLTAGDTVELQGYFRVADGYFAADHTSFWGCRIG